MGRISIERVAGPAALGEGAVWDGRDGVLWWVDITGGRVHRFDPGSGKDEARDWGEEIGSLAVREGGGLVLATKTGFHLFDPETGTRETIADPEADVPENRFNDGTTDRQGRFWAGTMLMGSEKPQGWFYRLDPDMSVSRHFPPVFVTNGMAFSPDGRRMYLSDSRPEVRMIWVCDYDPETGVPGERQVFFDTAGRAGRPDGGTVDADGCYWMAGVGGWEVVRITPEGIVDRVIEMPVEKPSKPMFGGTGLDTLYVTSIGEGVTPGADQPDAGCLFAVTGLGVTGVPEARFRG